MTALSSVGLALAVASCAVWMAVPSCVWGDDGDARTCLEDLRSRADAGDSKARLEQLQALYAMGKAETALPEWRLWIRTDPSVLSSVENLYWFCLTLMDTDHIGEAASLLEAARASGLLDAQRSYWSGMAKELLCAAYLELAELDRARELALEMLRHDVTPQNRAMLLYDLARAEEGLGEADRAKEAWELLASTEGSPEAVYAKAALGIRGPSPAVTHVSHDTCSSALVCLHLGSWRGREAALRHAADVRQVGVEVTLREDSTPSGSLVTLVVGPISWQEARAIKEHLASCGLLTVVETPWVASDVSSQSDLPVTFLDSSAKRNDVPSGSR